MKMVEKSWLKLHAAFPTNFFRFLMNYGHLDYLLFCLDGQNAKGFGRSWRNLAVVTFFPWYHMMSGGGTEYRLIEQVRLMVLPVLT